MGHSAVPPPYATMRNYKSWRRMMTPVNNELEGERKLEPGTRFPEATVSKPTQQFSQLPIQWEAEVRR